MKVKLPQTATTEEGKWCFWDHHTLSGEVIHCPSRDEDIFCSFNCCLARILDYKHDEIYYQSEVLLGQMSDLPLNQALHGRLLVQFGGPLSIGEF
jgi:hypothetical protein